MIPHTQTLHLFSMLTVLDCISLIITRFRIKKDCFGKVREETEEETVWRPHFL